MMTSSEDIIYDSLQKNGATITKSWYPVSERPERPPFAKELEYKIDNLFWGKVHLRNDGELYILVISKDVFNWKDKISQLKLTGQVEDAAGGLLWIKEDVEKLDQDLKFLREYLSSIRK